MALMRVYIVAVLVCVIIQRTADAACPSAVRSLYYNSGQLTSDNYPNDYDKGHTCQWIIYIYSSSVDYILYFEITDLDISCSDGDYLRITERNDDTDVWADNLCGTSTTPIAITGTDSAARVTFFSSNSGSAGRGFSMSWSPANQTACSYGTPRMYGNVGQLTSYNYPNEYDKGYTCEWIIALYSDYDLYIEITDLDIYEDSSLTCSERDHLTITKRNDDTDVWADNLCGTSTTPIVITGTGNEAYITFVTSSFGSAGRGFNISWSHVSQTAGCISSLVQYLYDDWGHLTPSNYPSDYGKGYTCKWSITTDSDYVLYIEITDLDIYEDSSLTCSERDYLRITERGNDTNVWADNLCGTSTTPIAITGTSHRASITFVASHFGSSGRGFNLSWSPASPTTASASATTRAGDSNLNTALTGSTGLTDTTIIIIGTVGGLAATILIIVIIYCVVKKSSSGVDPSTGLTTRQGDELADQMDPSQTERQRMRKQVEVSSGQESNSKGQAFVPLTSPAWKPGINLAPAPPKKAEPKKPAKRVNKPILPHIMISYQWDVKPEVLELRQKLADAGYRVWIDVEQMHKGTSTFEAMASAVTNAVVVIPVLTKKYQQSINCRKEIEFADKRKKPLVPICLEKGYKLEDWLDFLIGGAQSYTLCDEGCYDEELAVFFSSLEQLAEAAKIKEEEESENEEEEDDG